MKKTMLSLAGMLLAALLVGCAASNLPLNPAEQPLPSLETVSAPELSTGPAEPTVDPTEAFAAEPTIDPAETIAAEAHRPPEMTMAELEAKLGFGYRLPDESEYEGTIVTKYDDSVGEGGSILLEYSFDGNTVYVVKCIETRFDFYENYTGPDAERGSEMINGVEVRFRGDPQMDGVRGLAYWRQNEFQYMMNCETAALGVDILEILPLFVEAD